MRYCDKRTRNFTFLASRTFKTSKMKSRTDSENFSSSRWQLISLGSSSIGSNLLCSVIENATEEGAISRSPIRIEIASAKTLLGFKYLERDLFGKKVEPSAGTALDNSGCLQVKCPPILPRCPSPTAKTSSMGSLNNPHRLCLAAQADVGRRPILPKKIKSRTTPHSNGRKSFR